MNDRTGRIGIACAAGAFIGSLISLQISSSFWFVGTITGALVGYLTYDLKGVLAAIKQAWREMDLDVDSA